MLAGIIVTIILGGINLFLIGLTLYSNKKTRYVNIIVPMRIKWMETLREHVASFVNLINSMAVQSKSIRKMLDKGLEAGKIERLIELMLNPKREKDKKIIELMRKMMKWAAADLSKDEDAELDIQDYIEELIDAQAELVKTTRELLQEEEEKAREEAKKLL